MRRRIS